MQILMKTTLKAAKNKVMSHEFAELQGGVVSANVTLGVTPGTK